MPQTSSLLSHSCAAAILRKLGPHGVLGVCHVQRRLHAGGTVHICSIHIRSEARSGRLGRSAAGHSVQGMLQGWPPTRRGELV